MPELQVSKFPNCLPRLLPSLFKKSCTRTENTLFWVVRLFKVNLRFDNRKFTASSPQSCPNHSSSETWPKLSRGTCTNCADDESAKSVFFFLAYSTTNSPFRPFSRSFDGAGEVACRHCGRIFGLQSYSVRSYWPASFKPLTSR